MENKQPLQKSIFFFISEAESLKFGPIVTSRTTVICLRTHGLVVSEVTRGTRRPGFSSSSLQILISLFGNIEVGLNGTAAEREGTLLCPKVNRKIQAIRVPTWKQVKGLGKYCVRLFLGG